MSFLCGVNSTNAPWSWNDKDDGPIEGGEIATDPATLVMHYFSVPGGFSLAYTWTRSATSAALAHLETRADCARSHDGAPCRAVGIAR